MLLIILLSPANAADEETNWLKVSDKNGIKVYIKNVKGSDIVKAKSSTIVDASLIEVQAVLDDVLNRKNWMPYLIESKKLTPVLNNKSLEYSRFSAPWPASDREFVYSLELVKDTHNFRMYKMQSVSSALKPEVGNIIRAELYESIYTLSSLGDNRTHVELTFHADPKGWLPNWIINILQKVFPYRMLNSLREELKLRKGVSG